LLKGYFPAQWKVAQIILILKPGKPPNELTSYRPISTLSIVTKVFEKLLLKMLLPMVQAEALHITTNTSNRAEDKRSS
jgi:hypothetical protein